MRWGKSHVRCSANQQTTGNDSDPHENHDSWFEQSKADCKLLCENITRRKYSKSNPIKHLTYISNKTQNKDFIASSARWLVWKKCLQSMLGEWKQQLVRMFQHIVLKDLPQSVIDNKEVRHNENKNVLYLQLHRSDVKKDTCSSWSKLTNIAS